VGLEGDRELASGVGRQFRNRGSSAVSSDARVNAYRWNGNLKGRPFEVGGLAPYVTGGIGSFTSDTVVSDVMIGPTRFEDRRTATNFATNVGAGANYQIRPGFRRCVPA
jgi:hypothetical protein